MDIYSMTGEFEYPTSSQPVVGCLDSCILVRFLVDPIVHTHLTFIIVHINLFTSMYRYVHIHDMHGVQQ